MKPRTPYPYISSIRLRGALKRTFSNEVDPNPLPKIALGTASTSYEGNSNVEHGGRCTEYHGILANLEEHDDHNVGLDTAEGALRMDISTYPWSNSFVVLRVRSTIILFWKSSNLSTAYMSCYFDFVSFRTPFVLESVYHTCPGLG